MAKKKRAKRYWFDGTTIAAVLLAMFMINILLFSAGWLLGAAQLHGGRASARLTPKPAVRRQQLPTLIKRRAEARPTSVAEFVMPRWAGPPQVQGPAAPLAPAMAMTANEPRPRFVPRDYSALIEDAAYRESVPAYLVAAIARVESNFDANAVSNKGAMGIMQVMPETARRFGFDDRRLHDPVHNVAAGATYLRWLLERYDGDLDRVIAAYNAGEGAVDKYDGIPPYKETQDFVKRVRAVLSKAAPATQPATRVAQVS